MTATTIAIGTTAAVLSLFCWAIFFRGIWRMLRMLAQGQSVDRGRYFPVIPRLMTMTKEFAAHTRMAKFRTVGWAHWLVMVGFLLGFIFVFEAYGQAFDPNFHWPWLGTWGPYVLAEEVLGWATVIGGVTLVVIRQLNHPRVPERLSRFSGSNFRAAYFVEVVVIIEGLGMLGVKLFKIASGIEHAPIWASPTLHYLAMPFEGVPEWSVSAMAVLKLLSAMVWLAVVGYNINWGVAWHRFAAFFNIYLKREADGGVALGAAKPMMSQGKVLDMETADPDVDAFGAGKIEDFSWKGWLDFTTCTECGRCQSQCPAWNTGKPLSPKLLITSLRDHGNAKAPYLMAGGRKDMGGDEVGLVDADGNVLEDKLNAIPESARVEAERKLVGESKGGVAQKSDAHGTEAQYDPEEIGAVIDTETLWSCTTCGACVEQCPVDIEHVDHILDMRRYQVLIESDFPTELAGMFKNLENKGNPWGQNASARTNWIGEMDIEIPVFGQDVESFEGFEYLFWVGCAGAYEDRAKKTTKAVAELLDIAAVNFLVLGEGETCTGDSARRAGNEFLFQMLAQQNIEMLGEVFSTAPEQRKKIVVTCAHCFNALGNEYPQLGAKYEVVHHTQLLNRLVREKRLVPVAPLGEGVTYHDPCYLGRHNKVYDAPRELMAASGSQLTEMPRHGERSMCCGAGGARMWMEEQIGKRINIDRVDEALDTLGSSKGDTPQKVATGCPFCRVMLTDGVTARTANTEQEGKIEVVDVAQLLLESVRRGAPEVQRGGRFLGPASVPAVSEPEPAAAEEKEPEPAAAAATATTTEAKPKPKVGLGMKGGKKPGSTAKADAPAESKPAATAPAESAPAGKKPAAKGFGMGKAKKPGAASGGSAAPAPAEAESSAAVESAADAAPTEKKPAAKGFGMGSKAKKPGGKPNAAASDAGVTAPAENQVAETESAPEAAPTADTESAAPAATEAKAGKAKGFGMAAGKKRPGGAGAPTPKPAASAPAESDSAPSESEPTTSEPAPSAPAAAATETASTEAASTEAKPGKAKGFGMSAGKKRPGGIGSSAPKSAASAPAESGPEATASAAAESSATQESLADGGSVSTTEPTEGATEGTPADAASTEAKPGEAKGFGMSAGKKRPGGIGKAAAATATTAPTTAAPSETAAPADEPEASSAEDSSAVNSSAADSSQTAAEATSETAPEATETTSSEQSKPAAEAESTTETDATPPADDAPAPSPNGSSANGSSAKTISEAGASKAKGFGIAAGKKRPGHS
ncbi:heterodisulfide reductase-related iron-sulfur binding cluster [Gordonia sp. ABSL11-1]|uniref:heterodisulfide reductase-related iron-sulfur binding cluster n=1 Tax=Gordonia sp. ABSL11-1 TaxID=3053924 RepID=UPI0025730A6F|nr:heterodisulfide reductase-related iron-sulfur binding cluster [Gordonia sp. ABSL11-1]MDL9946549.1 heterodisulfide reductase-related iron-sulfur binding cluster [Gordonia sp. ABSL11-1]